MTKGRGTKEYVACQHLEPCLACGREAIDICLMSEFVVWYGGKYALDLQLSFFSSYFYLFYYQLHLVFVAAYGLSPVAESGAALQLWCWHRTAVGFLVEHGLSGMWASVVAARGVNSFSLWASLPCGM